MRESTVLTMISSDLKNIQLTGLRDWDTNKMFKPFKSYPQPTSLRFLGHI